MTKKSVFLIIALLAAGLTAVYAQTEGKGWPNTAKLAQYSLNNMPKPAGMSDIEWEEHPANTLYTATGEKYKYNVLRISFSKGTSAAHDAILAWFNSNGWTFKDPPQDAFGMSYMAVFVKGTYQADYYYLNTEKNDKASGWIKVGNTGVNAPNPSQLVTPAGKAWVIKDNDVQGSGRALVMKSDNTYEYYRRVYGIWIPAYFVRRDSKFSTYSATGSRLEINYANDIGGSYSFNHNYTIAGNKLTITTGNTGDKDLSGTWTLSDFSGPEKPGGGNVVLPAGMGWFSSGSQRIFNTSGIYAAYGYPSPWVSIGHEGTYSLNQAAGKITINESVPPQPGRDTVYNYSITDFGGGNKTLRIWGENRNGYFDDVYKVQAYPSSTKQPRTK